MKTVRFKGPMGLPSKTTRQLDQKSLDRLGVSVSESALTDGKLVFGPKTNHTIEMSDQASDSLVAALPKEFEIVENGPADELVEPMTALTSSQKDAGKSAKDKTDDAKGSSAKD